MNQRSLHISIIMDGNGRWAQRRGQPRGFGHAAGARAVKRAVRAALKQGVSTLTLHAFSSDNWKRPEPEVSALLRMFESYLDSDGRRCLESGVRLSVIGRRDRLPSSLVERIEEVERMTHSGTAMHLRIAIDYSARDAVVAAARRLQSNVLISNNALSAAYNQATHADLAAPAVDLLIRTGGEFRLSDLYGWDCSYAELLFTPKLWPDFGAVDLARAIADFEKRERRFGGLTAAA